jgi:hypothetical protein
MKQRINQLSKQVAQACKQAYREGFVWVRGKWIDAKKVVTDGCSGVPDLMMFSCCQQHDVDSTPGSGFTLYQAAIRFLNCMWRKTKRAEGVKQKIKTGIVTAGYFTGVCLFGWAYRLYKKFKQ